jgi:hypothetical protein
MQIYVFAHIVWRRWLVAQGREEEAYRVLEKLHFDGGNREWLDGEFAEICEVSNFTTIVPHTELMLGL